MGKIKEKLEGRTLVFHFYQSRITVAMIASDRFKEIDTTSVMRFRMES